MTVVPVSDLDRARHSQRDLDGARDRANELVRDLDSGRALDSLELDSLELAFGRARILARDIVSALDRGT